MDAGGVRRKDGSSNLSGRRPSRIGKADPGSYEHYILNAQTLALRPEGRETDTAHDQ
jgi:hypothetical protein